MPKLNQQGIIHLLILLILLIGIIGGVYLITAGPLKIFPKASEKKADSQEIDNLTKQLIQENNNYQQLKQQRGIQSADDEKKKLNPLLSIAIRRKEKLLAKIDSAPGMFLSNAVLADQKSTFPKEAQPYIEERIEIEGKLDIIHSDDFQNKKTKNEFLLQSSKNYILRFAEKPKFSSNSEFSVKGVALGSIIVVSEIKSKTDSTSRSISAIPVAAVGEQKTLAILVKLSGQSEPYSKEEVQRLMFDSSNSVKNFYKENSFNKMVLTGDVIGWLTINEVTSGSDICELSQMSSWTDKADSLVANSGVNITNYAHLIYLFPLPADYSHCPNGITISNKRNQSRALIFSNRVIELNSLIEHELGHNFGLGHANALLCGSESINTYDKCKSWQYGDYFNIMGGIGSLHFNSPQKYTLGWLPSANILTVSSNGRYTIDTPIEVTASSSGIQAIKISKDNRSEYYYLEFRKKIGFDSNSTPELIDQMTQGVRIHIWDDNNPIGFPTDVIDTSPKEAVHPFCCVSMTDVALKDGASFEDPLKGIKIRQLSHTVDSVTLDINLWEVTPTPTPTIALKSCTVCWADVNRDGLLNQVDIAFVNICKSGPIDSLNGNQSCRNADINNNNIVDNDDYQCITNKVSENYELNISQQCNILPTPTPPLIPKPSPKAYTGRCIQVITRACAIADPKSCYDFPTPCSIPDGWVAADNLTVTPTPASTIPQTQSTSFNCTCTVADITRDGQVNITDFSLLSSCIGKSTVDSNTVGQPCSSADVNQDGKIDNSDAECLKSQFGKKCPR